MTRTVSIAVALVVAVIAASTAAARSAARPTLGASARTVSFGDTLTLQGKAPGLSHGEKIQVLAHACGFTGPVPVGTARAGAGDTYKFTLLPQLNASYVVQVGTTRSNAATVTVRPAVQLRRVNAHTFAADVSVGAGQYFTSKVVVQAYDAAKGRWRTVANGLLKPNSDPGEPTAVSSAKVRLGVRAGTRLRALMTQAAVGACYRPATSSSLTA